MSGDAVPAVAADRTPLTKTDTKEYKEREAKAARMAAEIERSDAHQARRDLENGDVDEETLHSAVIRPGAPNNDSAGK